MSILKCTIHCKDPYVPILKKSSSHVYVDEPREVMGAALVPWSDNLLNFDHMKMI